MIQEIKADAFVEKIKAGQPLDILDVRTQIECRAEKLDTPVLHIPLHELDAASFASSAAGQELKGKPLYILCRSDGRAKKAAKALEAAGLAPVVVTGGLSACAGCNGPICKGKAISLERQVRISAGALVLAGVLLGHFLNPDFYILSGAIGAGLIFAGITDRCGMALLIARAPWNKADPQKHIQKSIETFQSKEKRP